MPILDRTAAELPVTIKASSYSVLPSDIGTELQFLSTSAISANLPAVEAVENGYNLIIRNIGTGTLTIDPDGAELIDGQSTLSLATDDWHWIRSDATTWKTIASNSSALADGSVTTAKLADNSVTGAKIAMGGDAQGDILYYDGTDYTRLAAGTSGQVLKTNGAGANPQWIDTANSSGKIVQVVNVMDSSVKTTNSAIPFDDTIPQNTEGVEQMTLDITPTNASNKLLIEVKTMGEWITSDRTLTVALFQDSTTDALAATFSHNSQNQGVSVALGYYMTAGTTSATTFKVRAGVDGGSPHTLTLNGIGGSRRYGGVAASSITITEIEA